MCHIEDQTQTWESQGWFQSELLFADTKNAPKAKKTEI